LHSRTRTVTIVAAVAFAMNIPGRDERGGDAAPERDYGELGYASAVRLPVRHTDAFGRNPYSNPREHSVVATRPDPSSTTKKKKAWKKPPVSIRQNFVSW
jgi:hypothetical protein